MAGTSSYPGALDNFSALSPTNLGDNDSTGRNHGERHDDLEAAVEAIQSELGVNPAGAAVTVVARLNGLPALSDDAPAALGTAAAGTATNASRSDHIHDEQDLSGLVSNSLVSAKGALISGSAASSPATLTVGANDTLLVADSGETSGLKWAGLVASQIPSLTSSKIPGLDVNAQADSYTLVLGDAGKAVEMGKATAQTLTVPPNSSVAFPVGTKIDVIQTGAGETTIAAGSGVTINSEGSKLKINAQWQAATLVHRSTDSWVLIGALKS